LWQAQRLKQKATIGVRVHAHAATAFGRQVEQLGHELSLRVEKLFGLVAAHPVLEDLQVAGLFADIGDRNLVSAPGSFHWLAIDGFGSGPTFRGAENEHGPAWALEIFVFAGGGLDGGDVVEHLVQNRGHFLVHDKGIGAFEEVR
jgi:hypothetical protein